MNEIVTHPVQAHRPAYSRDISCVPAVVSLRAYEVYRALYGEQMAMVTGHCRGGFSAGELIAFLYAYAFPRPEWRARVDEALTGMRNL